MAPARTHGQYLKTNFSKYQQEGRIKPSAPKVPGKNALVFVTYFGPHTGLDEATSGGKYIGQFFEHLGFTVLAEWYVLSEFNGNLENNTLGRMGDIRGILSEADLRKIAEDAQQLGRKLA